VKIKVTVKANSRENSVTRIGNNEFQLRVKAPAKQGKANEAVIDLLGEYFGIAKSRLSIVLGHTGKNKVIDLT